MAVVAAGAVVAANLTWDGKSSTVDGIVGDAAGDAAETDDERFAAAAAAACEGN